MSNIRNRILHHVRVRAGDLVPHELNPRLHPAVQRKALLDLYQEVGFARSLLAYMLPDGRLKLIDGHLRRDIDPEMLVDVEVLDVSDEEARKLLLSIHPLATLASHDTQRLETLRQLTTSASDELTNLWRSLGDAVSSTTQAITPPKESPPPNQQFLILIECPDEATQFSLLERFMQEGLRCRPFVS